jgi:hypothetical protein
VIILLQIYVWPTRAHIDRPTARTCPPCHLGSSSTRSFPRIKRIPRQLGYTPRYYIYVYVCMLPIFFMTNGWLGYKSHIVWFASMGQPALARLGSVFFLSFFPISLSTRCCHDLSIFSILYTLSLIIEKNENTQKLSLLSIVIENAARSTVY